MVVIPEHHVVRRTRNGRLEYTRVGVQRIAAGVIVRMLAAGVCGTDLGIYQGNREGAAEVLGHEGVGMVVAATMGTRVAPGDMVVVNPVSAARPDSVIGHERDGIFREFVWFAPEDVDCHLLRIPTAKALAADVKSLAICEPLVCALYALECVTAVGTLPRQQRIERQRRGPLVIVGSGSIAILSAIVWTATTGGEAFLLGSSPEHIDWLSSTLRSPAIHVLTTTTTTRDDLPVGRVDKVLLCTSRSNSGLGLSTALAIADEGATIDLVTGFPPDYKGHAQLPGVSLDAVRWRNLCGASPCPGEAYLTTTGKKIRLTGHRGTGRTQLLNAVEMLVNGTVSLRSIPHRVLSLAELPEAIAAASNVVRRRQLECVKMLVDVALNSIESLGRRAT